MFLLARAVVYVTVFVSVVFLWFPQWLLRASGIGWPANPGVAQRVGGFVTLAGAALAGWSILACLFLGRGTPAPFDPPRRLVTGGPYRYLRNPMYLAGNMAIVGAALFYQSVALLIYACVFATAAHLFVVVYEEPTLRRVFPHGYPVYCVRVRRWLPGRPRRGVH
jgi:protein-S-isoprenylcysteine O-methyltransferase Ste14